MQRFGGVLRLLKYPVAGVVQHHDGHAPNSDVYDYLLLRLAAANQYLAVSGWLKRFGPVAYGARDQAAFAGMADARAARPSHRNIAGLSQLEQTLIFRIPRDRKTTARKGDARCPRRQAPRADGTVEGLQPLCPALSLRWGQRLPCAPDQHGRPRSKGPQLGHAENWAVHTGRNRRLAAHRVARSRPRQGGPEHRSRRQAGPVGPGLLYRT